MRCASARFLRHAFDLLLYTSVAAALALTLLGVVNPASTKISCDDPSIRMPYSGDTITVTMLIVVTLIVPFFVMTIVEWAVPPSGQGSPPLREGLSRSWSYTGDIFVGGLFMFFLNDLAKTTVSEPRPHFWDTCRPNITAEQCRQPFVILSWRDCTNPLKQSHPRLIDSMKSFPSGHASLSVFSSIFMMVYIKQRIWGRSSRLLAPWIQLLWAVWTLYCCQSRIADNRHHWWDVLAGGILGAVSSFLTVRLFSVILFSFCKSFVCYYYVNIIFALLDIYLVYILPYIYFQLFYIT
ncbi:phospholipid phosphatase 2-like [Penaeus monodon]|uniref:phospholipid phosphatase 2-like n=1 Tax=Penaeus monodon TaxID=6687 RepID=UPI0018A70D67|nr:phospholipid phosphatase 2-like [Penaeus monodon]